VSTNAAAHPRGPRRTAHVCWADLVRPIDVNPVVTGYPGEVSRRHCRTTSSRPWRCGSCSPAASSPKTRGLARVLSRICSELRPCSERGGGRREATAEAVSPPTDHDEHQGAACRRLRGDTPYQVRLGAPRQPDHSNLCCSLSTLRPRDLSGDMVRAALPPARRQQPPRRSCLAQQYKTCEAETAGIMLVTTAGMLVVLPATFEASDLHTGGSCYDRQRSSRHT
jgi:hypothetical protein